MSLKFPKRIAKPIGQLAPNVQIQQLRDTENNVLIVGTFGTNHGTNQAMHASRRSTANLNHSFFGGDCVIASVLRQRQMDLQAWLKSYITRAFGGVTLEDGVDIHTAKFHDSYGFDSEEYRLASGCQRGNWTCVDPQLLRDRAWVLPFLDTKGFRFYLPVMMIDIIENERMSDLSETLFYNLKIDRFGRFKDVSFVDVFNRHQQAAIVRFLKFLLFNRGWNRDCDAGKLLTRLTDLRKQVAEPGDAPKSRNRRR